MAGEFTFDVVSEFDRQELVNAVDQAQRELRTRYDLKNTKSEVVLEKDQIVVTTESEFVLRSIKDLLESKVVRRGLSLKILRYEKPEQAAQGRVRQTIKLQRGISQELAREITKLLRDGLPKVRPQVQGDAVRVASKSKDELQTAIRLLKEREFPVALQFTNYR
ncbi:MAG: YajQ family cyclic di-GMP-binding protein [Chloroflexi bacterium]|nr:YajQ family cyclic di-GMP-binding protein [Chloroflexota bacterium]